MAATVRNQEWGDTGERPQPDSVTCLSKGTERNDKIVDREREG